jgi:hypothetical protein
MEKPKEKVSKTLLNKKVSFKSKSKPKDDVVKVRVGKDHKVVKNQSSWQIATPMQQSVDVDNVFKEVIGQNVQISLKDLMGVSFEMSRKFQQATKSQRVPVNKFNASVNTISAIRQVEGVLENVFDLDTEEEAELMEKIRRNALYKGLDEVGSEFSEDSDCEVNLSTVATAHKSYLAMVTA